MNLADVIVASLGKPILVLDAEFRGVTANPAFCSTMQISPENVAGSPIEELVVDGPKLRRALEKIENFGVDVHELEVTCSTWPNERKMLSVNARRLPHMRDIPELILVELRDVTKEREAARIADDANRLLRKHTDELEAANRELEAFTHSISHDLRTPLRLVSRIAHTLLDDYRVEMPAGAVQLVQTILDSTDEMGTLATTLLRFSRASREPLKKRRIDLRRMVQDSMVELSDLQKGRDVRITLDDLPPCQGDRAFIKQLVLNLLTNALKFTSECERAEIHVGFTHTSSGPTYFVRDNGIGFDPDKSGLMFVVFQRLHRTHKIEGSGVGLAIAKRIVERHGGRIWAEGEPGRGATFYFTLGGESDESQNSDRRK